MLKRVLSSKNHFVLTSKATFSLPKTVNIGSLSEINKETKNVELRGWAKTVQKRGSLIFIKIEDGRFNNDAQIVCHRKISQNVQVGSPIKASGTWKNSQGTQQNMELEAEKLEICGKDINPRYDVSLDNLRKKVHLRTRSNKFAAIVRARSRIFKATHDFFMNRDFIHIETPKLTKNDCEGGGEVFDVVTRGEDDANKLYLSVSSQLHLEAMVSRLSKVYTLGAAFRAEKQQSHAHLSEFSMLEAEIAFIEEIDEMCDLVEEYVKRMIQLTYEDEHLKNDLNEIGDFRNSENQLKPNLFSKSKWPKIEYSEAVEILKKHGEKVLAKSGLSKQNELFLVETFGGLPVFVTNYPVDQKPFYMARKDEKLTKSFDLLCPIVGELAGGSVRESDEEKLKQRGCEIEWYLELRRRGQPNTAGFGIGFERLLQLLFSIRNIKDTITFPRYYVVRMLTNDKSAPDVKKGQIFSEIISLTSEMFGDVGYSLIKSSLSIRAIDEDVFVVRVASNGEKNVSAILPFILKIGNQPMILQTIFIGRSMRSCEKQLIEIRRNELYEKLGKCQIQTEKTKILKTIKEICGKPSRIFDDLDMKK